VPAVPALVPAQASRVSARGTDQNIFQVSCVSGIGRRTSVIKFLLFCILLVLCWPLALVALVLYPLVWLVLLPFRIVGIAVGGVLELVWAIVTLPARVVRALV
jgi:hypothetical protein